MRETLIFIFNIFMLILLLYITINNDSSRQVFFFCFDSMDIHQETYSDVLR